jgi:hypothetical protein
MTARVDPDVARILPLLLLRAKAFVALSDSRSSA